MANSSLEKLIKSLSRGELKTFSLSIKNNQSPEYYKPYIQLVNATFREIIKA